MATRKLNSGRASRQKKDDLKAMYAKVRAEFTAADLQKYTVIEEGIPLRKVVAEAEEIHRKMSRKRKKA